MHQLFPIIIDTKQLSFQLKKVQPSVSVEWILFVLLAAWKEWLTGVQQSTRAL